DYNLFYIEDGGAIGTYGFTSAVTLAAWQAASSQDANSLEADPEFASLVGVSGVHAQTATENNFYLKSDSPAIDAGTDLSDYFTDDYVGVTRPYEEAWDIGAYEYATPEKPTKLKVKDKGAKWLKLKWTASPSTISKYWVKIATDESFSDMVGYEVAADKTSKKITGLLPNKKYYIKVKAQYESYYSGYSNIKRPRTMPPQAKKKYMKAKSITSNSAVLKWKKPKRAITRYVLQLKVGKDIIDTIKLKRPTGNKAKKKWNNKKQWQKTQLIDLTEDTTYKWRLRSKYKKINSKWSKYKKFTTKSE
ncbi:fibronectin type III domain-containing protein, partial [Patescibacteria group bacterium]|nr:fibronectin type III domain-containing protein [Patescibacteria group bacterium]